MCFTTGDKLRAYSKSFEHAPELRDIQPTIKANYQSANFFFCPTGQAKVRRPV